MKNSRVILSCLLILAVLFAAGSAKKSNVSLNESEISEHSAFLKKEATPENFESASTHQRFHSRKSEHTSTSIDEQIESSARGRGGTFTRRESRKGQSVLGDMLCGAIMFFAGFPCIWFNEKGYAKTKTFLNKYVKVCTPGKCEEVNPNLEGKLVCINGQTSTNDVISDNLFSVIVNSSIRLTRKCEMLSWVETRSSKRVSDDEDEVTYSYDLEWTDSYVESRNFAEPTGHENTPGDWLYDKLEQTAPHVNYGMFVLSESQKAMCHSSSAVPIPQQAVDMVSNSKGFAKVDTMMGYNAPPPATSGYYGNAAGSYQKKVSIKGEYLMIQKESSGENSGDFRISFLRTPCGPITVVGQQKYNVIETFSPEEREDQEQIDGDELESGGCCSCCGLICKVCKVINQPISEINWVAEATQTKQQMFQSKLSDYETKTWIFRLVGFLLFMFGVYLMLSPVYTFLYWFPLVGRYIGTFGSFICGLVGFLVAIPFWLLTLSFAWLFYRKEIGIPLLLVGLAILGYFMFAYNKRGAEPTQF